MTVHEYNYTFGFLVPIDDCLKVLGFTEDNFTKEKREEVVDEYGYDETDDIPIRTLLRNWFELECGGGYSIRHQFYVNGNGIRYEFVIRSFVHAHEHCDVYYSLGVELGSLSRFEGEYKKYEGLNSSIQPIDLIRILASEKNWLDVIKKSGNSHFGSKKDGIFIGQKEYSKGRFYDEFICPEVIITTDDCDCCS